MTEPGIFSTGTYSEGKVKALPFFCLLFFLAPFLEGLEESPSLPLIQRLDPRDKVFAQYISEVESTRRRVFGSRAAAPDNFARDLAVYAYAPGPGEDLLRLAARCNIPYSGIATLNRLQNPADLDSPTLLFLPSVPGLFIPEKPETELERLLDSSREGGELITIETGGTAIRFRFLPGEDYNSTERIFFLRRGFSFPLKNFRITSGFGPRRNPVTGNHRLHQGLDLAAPQGTEVYATREGTVREQGEDPILGNYIIIAHNDSWVSLYGHLSKIETTLREEVNSGSLIGRVGSTGQSTGPHLHFELRQHGTPQNPEGLLRLFEGN